MYQMRLFVLFTLIFLFHFSSQAQVFNMGDASSTTECSGTLYDSGGANGNYWILEDLTFTICPSDPFECLAINLEEYNTEFSYDVITLYAGANTSAPQIGQFSGFGNNVNYEVPSGCITVRFESDLFFQDDGFKLTWECKNIPCTLPPIVSCADPIEIASLPYSGNDLSTCGAGNTISSGPCNNDEHLQNEEYIFTYNSPGSECISIALTGTSNGTAIAVYDDCPTIANDCLALAGGGAGQNNPSLSSIFLDNPGTYYFVVGNASVCTDFSISVEQVSCPVVFPSAAQCEDALSLNGCGDLPAIITVGSGQGDPTCIQPFVNNGCWPTLSGSWPYNYTWFYFEAQSNGNFGFTMEAANPNEASDVDFQIWGPISNVNQMCNYVKNNQPIRSSYADGADPTGLANIHPINGGSVNDVCEDAFGDDFVRTLPVQTGQLYVVLVNDWGEAITSGAVSIDFSNTTDGVLGNEDEAFSISPDVVACPNEQVQFEAEGGAIYNWLNTQGLSCANCPNPILTVSQSGTYEVEIIGVCSTDTLSINVELVQADLGADLSICLNGTTQLSVGADFTATDFEWSGPAGTLSCTNCPNPVVTGLNEGTYTYAVSISGPDCTASDEIEITVLPQEAPPFDIQNDQSICLGDNIELGGNEVSTTTYTWTSEPSGFNSNEFNPIVNPLESTTYYLEAMNSTCPFPVFDSVLIVVDEIPGNLDISIDNPIICEGDLANLSSPNFDPNQYPNAQFEWFPNEGLQNPNTDLNMTVQPNGTNTYYRIATNGACIDTNFATVEVISSDLQIQAENLSLCEGDSVQLITGLPESSDIIWMPSESLSCEDCPNPTANPEITTEYFVTGVAGGCPINASILIEVIETEFILDGITSNPDTNVVFKGVDVELIAQIDAPNLDDLQIVWSTGGMTNSIIVNPVGFTEYIVTVTDQNSCAQSAIISFETIKPEVSIPNAFTPDGDGLNDVFQIITYNAPVEVLDFKIYNRWGALVHNANGENHGWDGTQDGKPSPSDVYVFRANYVLPDGQNVIQDGELTLLR